MSDPVDSKPSSGDAPTKVDVVDEKALAQVDHVANLDEKAHVADYKADAIEAENAEHQMGVLDAVKAYPMASFWAFVMSFTIVCGEAAFPCFCLVVLGAVIAIIAMVAMIVSTALTAVVDAVVLVSISNRISRVEQSPSFPSRKITLCPLTRDHIFPSRNQPSRPLLLIGSVYEYDHR